MDPNIALADLRNLISEKRFEEAAVVFTTLDAWIVSGGFLPKGWSK